MVFEVEIRDNEKSPLGYLSGLESFSNGKVFKFNKGVNIIIGKNGCGKSTLINLISSYMLCNDSIMSRVPDKLFMIDYLFQGLSLDGEKSILDGVDVKSDYAGVVYHYLSDRELSGNSDGILSSIDQFGTFLANRSASTGEGVMNSLNNLINCSFKNKDIQFPINEILERMKRSNDYWKNNLKMLLGYYKRNHVAIAEDDFQYTFLMDEVDANLDITNVETMYQILSYQKDMTQLICVVHNPVLIYKLSKLDHVNIVEMTDGYLDSIKKIFEEL